MSAERHRQRLMASNAFFAIKLGSLNCLCTTKAGQPEQHELLTDSEPRKSYADRSVIVADGSDTAAAAADVKEEVQLRPPSFRGESAPLTANPAFGTTAQSSWPPRGVPGSFAASSSTGPLRDQHGQRELQLPPASGGEAWPRDHQAGSAAFSAAAPREGSPPHQHHVESLEIEPHATVYLNLTVKDSAKNLDTMVHHQLEGKLSEHRVGHALFETFAHLGTSIAAKVSFDKVATQIARDIPHVVAEHLSFLGVQADAVEVFQQGSFVVLRLSIIDCPLPSKGTARKAGGCCGRTSKKAKDHEAARRKLELETAALILLPTELPKSLEAAGYQVLVHATNEQQEAMCIFSFLRGLEQKGKERPQAPVAPKASHVIFLNMVLLSKTPELENTIKEQMKEKVPNPFGRGILQGLAARAAAKFATPDRLAEKMAAKVPQEIPATMEAMGIIADAEEVYRKGSFLVVRLSIEHVDMVKLLQVKAGARASRAVGGGMGCMAGLSRLCCGTPAGFHAKVDEAVCRKVMEKLKGVLPTEMPRKLDGKGIRIHMEAKRESEEAPYFLEVYRHLQAGSSDSAELGLGNDTSTKFRRFPTQHVGRSTTAK